MVANIDLLNSDYDSLSESESTVCMSIYVCVMGVCMYVYMNMLILLKVLH